MILRPYRSGDAETLGQLFHNTVHAVCGRDYTQEQLHAWSPGSVDLAAWNNLFLRHDTRVAVEGELVLGFADMDATGYLDHLYVHHNFQRQGIATTLCDALERACTSPVFRTHASRTARPFFEARGYIVLQERLVVRLGVGLAQFVMEKRPGMVEST